MKKNLFIGFLILTLLSVACSCFGQIFWEENQCKGNEFWRNHGDKIWDLTKLKVYTYRISWKQGGGVYEIHEVSANDEFRSVSLVRDKHAYLIGKRILIYDASNRSTSDDWTEILIKDLPPSERVCIGSLEQSFSNQWVTVTHHHVNGLDGKVSYVEVTQ